MLARFSSLLAVCTVYPAPELIPLIPFSRELQRIGETIGRMVLVYDDQGNVNSATFTGTVEDVCQLLQ